MLRLATLLLQLFAACALSACSERARAAGGAKVAVDSGARLDAAPARPVGAAPAAAPTERAPVEVAAPNDSGADTREPERIDAGPRRIRFADLSLVGYDVDAIFDPDDESQGFDDLPESLRELDGKDVALDGYMLPLEWEGKEVRSFMLVRDMASCCFGGMPMPDEWVEVTMAAGRTTEYFPYIPVLVTGALSIGGEVDDLGYVTGAYRLTAVSVADDP